MAAEHAERPREKAAKLKTINWDMSDGGQRVNPLVNCCKFVPGQNLVLVGVNDTKAAKCFNYATGEVVEWFNKVEETCFTLDVSEDGGLCCFGDGSGHITIENIAYTQRI